jgi:hypothetical protein
MERVRAIQGTPQLRVRQVAVSRKQAPHFQRKCRAVDMCIIAEAKNPMKSMVIPDGTQASDQLHAVVIAPSI